MISPEHRNEVIDALRRGTVPQRSLDAFAVGLQPFEAVTGEELESVCRGRAQFKAVRGEYGSGKTFFARWLQERAKRLGFATAEVQISETETPLHRLETVYRRLMERLATGDSPSGAFRSIIDGWFFALEQDVLAEGTTAAGQEPQLLERTNALMEQRLAEITKQAPAFAATLRAYRSALASNDTALADGLLAWLAGQPNVSASVKRSAGVKGDIDHFGALNFLQGLLVVLRDSGHAGLILVLDEVETLQRVRGDVREKGLNAIRQLIDEVDSGRFPGLYLVITGTPAFFDGPRAYSGFSPLHSACMLISRLMRASTTRAPSRFVSRPSTTRSSAKLAGKSETSSRSTAQPPIGSVPRPAMSTLISWRWRSRAVSAARWGSLLVCS